jgi:RND family efflux transporter MFP subunit
MSNDPIKHPNLRRLMLAGAVALALAGAVAANGIISRADSARSVAQWTDNQVIPTVALANLTHDSSGRTLTLPGTIQAYSKASIYARVSGYLHSWQTDLGAHVTSGQVLALIDTPDLDQQLAQAQADLATAQANEQISAVTSARYQELLARKVAAQQIADEKAADAASKRAIVNSAQANVHRLEAMEDFKTIVAPFDGIVTARKTDVGALINSGNAGQELFEVSDLHKVRIYVQVPQAFSADVRPGLTATFELPQYAGQQFDAAVVSISNAMDPSSRSMLIELQADNTDGKFFAGVYCQVHFHLPADPDAVRVPATALVPVDQGVQIAVLGDDNKVRFKSVQLGHDFGDSVEVLAGLSPADRVIDSPPETLQTGDDVRLASTKVPTKVPVANTVSAN